jgi:hypothetical protein
VPPNWIGVCPVGHVTGKRYRRPSAKRSCGKCSRVYDERFLISWKPAKSLANYEEVFGNR